MALKAFCWHEKAITKYGSVQKTASGPEETISTWCGKHGEANTVYAGL